MVTRKTFAERSVYINLIQVKPVLNSTFFYSVSLAAQCPLSKSHYKSLSFQITESLFKQMIPVITLHCLPPTPHPPVSLSVCPSAFFFFSLCVYVWTRKQPSYLNTQAQWTAGQPVEAQLWVNFALTLKLAVWELVLGAGRSTQHRWLSKEEVNGTGKQEVPARWLTACLDTKRWILAECWLTNKSPLTDRICKKRCCRGWGVVFSLTHVL